MPPADPEAQLREFQETGKTDRLLEFVRSSGRHVDSYRKVLAALRPVLEPLSFGEQPRYDDVEHEALAAHVQATVDVIRWSAGSNRADLRSAALRLMGTLGWDEFSGDLLTATRSPDAWERLAAKEAVEAAARGDEDVTRT